MTGQRRYLSYLLRLWQESGGSPLGDAPVWRASLESPAGSELKGFLGPEELFAYLREQMSLAPAKDGTETGQRTPGTDQAKGELRRKAE
jgi:hypothetical protein